MRGVGHIFLSRVSFLLFSFLLFSFGTGAVEDSSSPLTLQKQKRLLALISKGEEMESWRKDMQELYIQTKSYVENHRGKIFSRHLEEVYKGVHRYRRFIVPGLRAFTHAAKYDFFGKDFIVKISSKKKSLLNRHFSRLMPGRNLRSSRQRRRRYRKTVTKFVINPADRLGRELFRELLYQVSGRLLVLDNFSLALIPYIDQANLRYALINNVSGDSSDLVEKTWHDYVNTLYRSEQLEGLIEDISQLRKRVDVTKEEEILLSLVDHSVTGRMIQKRLGKFTFFKDMFKTMSFMAKRRWSAYRAMGAEAIYQAGKIFGNTIRHFQSREGKLYSMAEGEEEKLKEKFRPLDIFVEKSPFALTDKFIPGYFGHVGLWLGTEKDMKELGVWDELPRIYAHAVKKYGYPGEDFQKAMRKGARVAEALSPRVRFRSFRQFIDADDLLVMRSPECEKWDGQEPFCLDKNLKREYLIKAFEQIGKEYDFAFDVNTDDKIVCSELIYRTYLDVDFETSLTLGSYNISPDQVVKKGDEEGDLFTPILFFHDGKEYKGDIRGFLQEVL